ncbi:unnamed protein product [Caenorhabditis nigoni]
MRTLLVVILFIKLASGSRHSEELEDTLKSVTNEMFSLSAADEELLDEINRMRSLIASGFFNDPFKNILKFIFEGAKQLVDIGVGAAKDVAVALANQLHKWGEIAVGWASDAIKSLDTLKEAGKEIGKGFENAGNAVADGIGGLAKSVGGGLFGRRRKRFFGPVIDYAKKKFDDITKTLEKPKNTFGAASNMNMLVWNRRLAQLAMVKKKDCKEKEVTVVTYEGKQYRMLKYGTLATYVITNTLGSTIAKLFTTLRTAYLACKLWFAEVNVPIQKNEHVLHKTHEVH